MLYQNSSLLIFILQNYRFLNKEIRRRVIYLCKGKALDITVKLMTVSLKCNLER